MELLPTGAGMAIGSRGGRYLVLAYDPLVKRKRYVGTFDTREDAEIAEAGAKARFGSRGPNDAESVGWRGIVDDDTLASCEAALDRGEQLVYFVQGVDGGPIKIGLAADPDERLKELQVGSPARLLVRCVLAGGSLVERELHLQFAASRLWGEWFEPTPALMEIAHGAKRSGEAIVRTYERLAAERNAWRSRAQELETVLADLRRVLDAGAPGGLLAEAGCRAVHTGGTR